MYSVRRLVPVLACCMAVFLTGSGLLLLLGTESHKAVAAPDYSYATVGGIQYHVVLGRQIHPSDQVDAHIVKGLPAKERRAVHHRVLYGAFVSLANHTGTTLPSASRIDLLDSAGHLHRPLPLSAKNPYTYAAGKIAPGRQVPPMYGTPAADNLAAGGQLLLYRVPAWQLRNGSFQLVVHDPLHPTVTAPVQM